MQPALDRNTLDRLIDLGRKQGQLTTADLRTSLPIEAMSAEEIALIVVHLEETGIAVELEDSLLSADPKPQPVRPEGAEIIPFPAHPERPERGKSKAVAVQAAGQPAIDVSRSSSPSRAPHARWTGAAAGSVILLALALLTVLLAT